MNAKMNESLIYKLRNFCKERGIVYCAIFGSRARGGNKKGSDLDLLINTKVHGLKFVGLTLDLEEFLGVKVDVITRDGLKHPRGMAGEYFKKEVERSLKVIYLENSEGKHP